MCSGLASRRSRIRFLSRERHAISSLISESRSFCSGVSMGLGFDLDMSGIGSGEAASNDAGATCGLAHCSSELAAAPTSKRRENVAGLLLFGGGFDIPESDLLLKK